MVVIEMNLWVSCSFVLVLKVIGFFIVKVVIMFVVGFSLDEI